ncbi:TPA: tetratricopeptide repeat protein [Candidatus Poribacteria bacterium]|nr:tetratricopeptide repeat protein [Candidatus Poribacteria bacterium]HIA68382.1 tetratricopeptide repeat protein [Candidatus Poribacteria bacterium]HIB88643.1 tetratricopeptide repeat protein [Candidatus Poribacteria bacterium]HIC01205.1 tetratricopeptide repeat protein [Candidatus Poribacteria bacterium]HIO79360.1 tetratricopeptide repeat protein [Candidatus Poribacteria bacterium]
MNRQFLLSLIFSSLLLSGCLFHFSNSIPLDPRQRISYYADIYKLNPESDQARQAQLEIGKIYYNQLGNPARGLEIFEKLISSNPTALESGEALWYISSHNFQENEYELACQKFLQFMLDFSGDERSQIARLRIADCFFELGNLDSAIKYYVDYRNRYPDDLPNLPYVLLRIGTVYANQPNSAIEARKAFSHIIEKFPNAMPQVEIARKRLLDLGGVTVRDSGVKDQRTQLKVNSTDLVRQTSEAGIGPITRPNAQSVFAGWTRSATFGYNAKVLLQQSGMLDVAEVRTSMAGRGELLDDVVFNVGLQFYMMQDYHRAGACLEKTVELGIRGADLCLKLGVCYRKAGKWTKAAEAFRALAKVAPKDIDQLIDSSAREYRQGNREYGRKSLECLIGISDEFDGKINKILKE